jgi:hypothetical protein
MTVTDILTDSLEDISLYLTIGIAATVKHDYFNDR